MDSCGGVWISGDRPLDRRLYREELSSNIHLSVHFSLARRRRCDVLTRPFLYGARAQGNHGKGLLFNNALCEISYNMNGLMSHAASCHLVRVPNRHDTHFLGERGLANHWSPVRIQAVNLTRDDCMVFVRRKFEGMGSTIKP